MQRITSKEFTHTFCDIWDSTDRRICFVIGAGVSKSSGIRTGAELAREWLDDIESRMKDQPDKFNEFLATYSIDKSFPATHYPDIYKERFKFDFNSGLDFINKEMENAKPSYGYSVLAQILAEKQHNTIITTNFDNLTEEALYTYTSKRPLICGHELLAIFAKPSIKRPLIIKIHRDRFLEPQNLPEQVEHINELWIDSLNNIFKNSTPIFIGYGGNDGSLMGYMEKINSLDNIFWCERTGVAIGQRVEKLLRKHNGKIVEIEGFDELMFTLQDGLRLKLLDKEIVEIAQIRSKAYQETVEKMRSKQAASPDKDVQKAAQRMVEKAGSDWWAWELKAQAAQTIRSRNKVYQEALRILPDSPELNGNYAEFLKTHRKYNEESEKYFKRALELDPTNASNNANYANFLSGIRKDYNKAETHYTRALEFDPNNASINYYYASFLKSKLENFDSAEKYYKRAIELEPANASYYRYFANFLNNVRKDYEQAKSYYEKSLEFDPSNEITHLSYANFLKEKLKNYSEAEAHYKKALELEPSYPAANFSYAVFLQTIRKDYDTAEKYFRHALELQPDHPNYNSRYAFFLNSTRKNYDEAEKYYKAGLEKNPAHLTLNVNYAAFLIITRQDYPEAEKYLKKTLIADPNNIYANIIYARLLGYYLKRYDEAAEYFKKILTLDPGNVHAHYGYARLLGLYIKDRDEAKKYFIKTLQIDPENINATHSYAIFFKNIDKNYDEAEKYFKKAIELDPDNANINGNYAGFLFIRDKQNDAVRHMEKAFINCNADPLLAELWFYRYAHIDTEKNNALENLKELLCKNKVRSIDFNLQDNVEYAISHNHPYPELLQQLADLLTKDIPSDAICNNQPEQGDAGELIASQV